MPFRLKIFCYLLALIAASLPGRADEAKDLKAELDALENQVDALTREAETEKPVSSNGSIIVQRGQGSLATWNTDRKQDGEMPADRGYTITTNPTAGSGVPKTEVTISGSVGGTLIVDGK